MVSKTVLTFITIFCFNWYLVSGETWPKAIFMGDGFVETCFSSKSPWCSMLSNHLVRVCDVMNRGVYQYNTRFYLNILHQVMKNTNPVDVGLVVIFLGTIDSYAATADPKLNVPLPEFRSNLRQIIRELTEKYLISTRRIIVITPPPYLPSQQKLRPAQNALLYANATIEVAKEFQISWLDLKSQMEEDYDFVPKEWAANFDSTSGLFNTKGALYFFNYIWPHVQVKLKEFMGSAYLIKKFPMWSPSPSG